jgi:acetyl-CoA C-acetyltransferase
MTDAVVVSATRSPIGRARKGSLVDVRPDDLAAQVVQAALDAVPGMTADELDDLMLGCAEPSGEHGTNLARVVAVLLGHDGLPGTTVNRFCSSSVQTTRMAMHAIRAGEGHAFVSAGVECISRYRGVSGSDLFGDDVMNPRFDEARDRTARTAELDADWHDPRDDGHLPDIYIAMGQTAENVAHLRGIDRERQDRWGVQSQNRAEAAIAAGHVAAEITPVTTPSGEVVTTDDGPRAEVTYEKVSQLQPVFRATGTVTAGNCCALNDGAAALVVTSADFAHAHGLTPLARVVSTGVSALSPEIMGLGPVEASRQALERAGLTMADVDLVEINEAFASQVLASADELGIDEDRLNVHGGAIAYGHPFGATGARITTTLLNALRVTDGTIGLETMCVGGGQGMAVVYERLS